MGLLQWGARPVVGRGLEEEERNWRQGDVAMTIETSRRRRPGPGQGNARMFEWWLRLGNIDATICSVVVFLGLLQSRLRRAAI